MASKNGELTQVHWQMWIYWIVMILLALIGINVQLADRRKHMEAYVLKGYYNANMESYKSAHDRYMTQRNVTLKGQDYSDAEADENQYHPDDDDSDYSADFNESKPLYRK